MQLKNKDHSEDQRQSTACNYFGKKSRNSDGIVLSIKKYYLRLTQTPL